MVNNLQPGLVDSFYYVHGTKQRCAICQKSLSVDLEYEKISLDDLESIVELLKVHNQVRDESGIIALSLPLIHRPSKKNFFCDILSLLAK